MPIDTIDSGKFTMLHSICWHSCAFDVRWLHATTVLMCYKKLYYALLSFLVLGEQRTITVSCEELSYLLGPLIVKMFPAQLDTNTEVILLPPHQDTNAKVIFQKCFGIVGYWHL